MTNRSGDLGVPPAAWGWGRQMGSSSHRCFLCVFLLKKKSKQKKKNYMNCKNPLGVFSSPLSLVSYGSGQVSVPRVGFKEAERAAGLREGS